MRKERFWYNYLAGISENETPMTQSGVSLDSLLISSIHFSKYRYTDVVCYLALEVEVRVLLSHIASVRNYS